MPSSSDPTSYPAWRQTLLGGWRWWAERGALSGGTLTVVLAGFIGLLAGLGAVLFTLIIESITRWTYGGAGNHLDDSPWWTVVLVLSPVGVRPDLHRQGIGSAMITQALGLIAGTRPEPAVFLEGDPAYYRRLGFEAAGTYGFRRPSLRIPEPAFQVFRLPSFDATLSGTLVYPDAFWRTDSVGLR